MLVSLIAAVVAALCYGVASVMQAIAVREASTRTADGGTEGGGHEGVDPGLVPRLLHHSQVNPLSAPFWYRMGYRPLWTSWEARPASALR